MSNPRKIVFQNGYIYHIFNRAVEGKQIFATNTERERALMLSHFYRFEELPMRLSHLLQLSPALQSDVLEKIKKQEQTIKILAFAIMPNHFHFLLQQEKENGIAKFISNFSNAYAKYYNTKHKRNGHIFQGRFKAVFIENDEQLIHVSRYIHLNPVVSSIIELTKLKSYRWTSYTEYITPQPNSMVSTELINSMFLRDKSYEKFVEDHVSYARELHLIKSLICE